MEKFDDNRLNKAEVSGEASTNEQTPIPLPEIEIDKPSAIAHTSNKNEDHKTGPKSINPTKIEDIAKEAEKFYLQHPEALPPRIRLEVIRDLVGSSTNEATTKLQSEIEQAEKNDPSQAFVTKIFVDAWLLTHGFRRVEDKRVSDSIRHERELVDKEKNGGLIKRMMRVLAGVPEKTVTEIIKHNEALASITAQLEVQKQELEAKNEQLKENNSKLMEGTSAQISEIIKSANQKAGEIIEGARESAESIVEDAKKSSKTISDKTEEIKNKAEQSESEILSEVKKHKARLEELQKQIASLEAIKAELKANPQVFEVYNKQEGEDKEGIEREMESSLVDLLIECQSFVSNEYEPNVLEDILQKFKNLYELAEKFDEKFGFSDRVIFFSALYHRIYTTAQMDSDQRWGRTELKDYTSGYHMRYVGYYLGSRIKKLFEDLKYHLGHKDFTDISEQIKKNDKTIIAVHEYINEKELPEINHYTYIDSEERINYFNGLRNMLIN